MVQVDTNLFGGPWSSVVEQLLGISALLSYAQDLNVVLGQHHLRRNKGRGIGGVYGYMYRGMCLKVCVYEHLVCCVYLFHPISWSIFVQLWEEQPHSWEEGVLLLSAEE